MLTHLLIAQAISLLVYMSLWYGLAYQSKRLDVVDTAWGGAFIVVAWLAVIIHPVPATMLMALLVTVWGARLMYMTWSRHLRHDQDDPRYTRLSSGWRTAFWLQVFLKIFLLQGVLTMLVAAPVTVNVRASGLSAWALAGAVLWLVGFIFEAVGDAQLKAFLAQAKRRKRVMDQGLWRYSRHPNYFGESLQWWGLAVLACVAPWGGLGLVGPLLITSLLVFVSGIPTVERGKDKDPDYRAYQQRTSPFIPLPPRRKAGKA